MSDSPPRRTQAQTRRSWWPGWIWAIPIAAVGVCLWLGLRALAQGGEKVTVTFASASGVKSGDTKVVYRGVTVGKVSDVALTPSGDAVTVKLRLDRSVDHLLRSGTRFWLVGAKPELSNPSSLKALVAGPEIAMAPGSGQPARRFKGLEEPPREAPLGPQVPYVVLFSGAVGGLKAGAPVELDGFPVGEVTGASLSYDAGSGVLDTPVKITLEPYRLHIVGGRPPRVGGDWRPAVDDMLRRLIASGLRAEVTEKPPVIGEPQVTLTFVKAAAPASLGFHDGLEAIPSTPAPDIDALEAKASRILTKVDNVPIQRIGDNIRAATDHIRRLTSSPKLQDTLNHVDHAAAGVDQAVSQAEPQVGPLIRKLRDTANQADEAVTQANTVIGGSPQDQDSDLPSALHELTDAARSVRALADYLERHPDALIKGKSAPKAVP